ncbi:MAG: deoxyribonuclease IV [Patescibacteria group bacterium]|jgi:deoxyribonuclease-4
MLFGAHISAAGGVQNAPENSAREGGEVFQFFSRPPQGGPAPKLTPEIIKQFKANCQKYGQKESYLHAPYFINFASANPRIKYGSIAAIREELERGTALGAKYLMTHLGSAKDLGIKPALKQTAEGVIKVLTGYRGSCELLLENSAGSGEIIGDDFAELGTIIKAVTKKLPKIKIGVCLDTCHAFASGYGWQSPVAVSATLKEFDRQIGLKYLKLIHLNDSLAEFNSHRDRHADLGDGQIGREGIIAIVKNLKLKKLSFILETPGEAERLRDLKFLKNLRS